MSELDAVRDNARLSRWAELLPRRPDQLGAIHGADAELVPLGAGGDLLALKVDAVVEEVTRGLYDPRTAGYVAVAGALSDLAAVSATPIGVLLAVTLPRGDTASDVQREVALGAREACDVSGTYVLGGDTSDGDALAITCAAAGLVPRARALCRIGARPGDVVVTTGPLGSGAIAAATHVLTGAPSAFRPVPRLEAGRALGGVATACIDTSDGLLAALDQLARLNAVRVRITGPVRDLLLPAARALATDGGLSPLALVACPHGEFELVATAPGPRVAELRAAGVPLLEIGRVEEGDGVFEGDRALPTGRLRDLWDEHGGQPAAYLAALLEVLGP
jgi:thiamine-monophosphate kinase